MAVNKTKTKVQPVTESEGPAATLAEPTPSPEESTRTLAEQPVAPAETTETALAPAETPRASGDLSESPSAILGMVLVINNKEFTVNSDAITEFKTKGFEFGLSEPVDLGTFQSMVEYLNKEFNLAIPTTGDGLPPPLDGVVNTVKELDVTITKAHIRVPGAEPPGGKTQYTLEMNVSKKEGNIGDLGPLGIKGFVIGVTNEPKTPTETSNPSAQ
jgi:hypothetical protein